MQVLTARRLITAIGVVEYPVVRVGEDGLITEIESDPSLRSAETLAGGLFDVHTHGAAGRDVMEEGAMPVVGRFLATRGVTHYLPTTVTAPVDATLLSLERLADAIEAAAGWSATGSSSGFGPRSSAESRPEAQPMGIHLEGPFVSHLKRGVHPVASILEPSVTILDRFWRASRGHVALMTIAPEVPGALEVIEYAVSLGIRISIGHSNATAAEARAAIAAGAVSATHTFNAMRALDHREPGILGVVLDDDALFAELICDGVHVAPEVVRLWWKAKGVERGLLVTDSMAATGMPEGQYMLAGLPVTVAGGVCLSDGVLAGSVLTLDRAVENLRTTTGAPLASALRLASANPARMLGLEQQTAVTVGAPANLTRFDAAGRLSATYVRGREVRAGE